MSSSSILTERGEYQHVVGWEAGGGVSSGGMGHLQMVDCGAKNSQAKEQSTSRQGDDSERARSYTTASTSHRCGFHWLHKELEERLAV